jgi:hypothetical protein
MFTAVAPVKLVPEMVTTWSTPPEVGVKEVIVGQDNTALIGIATFFGSIPVLVCVMFPLALLAAPTFRFVKLFFYLQFYNLKFK